MSRPQTDSLLYTSSNDKLKEGLIKSLKNCNQPAKRGESIKPGV
jgi:hypothetical protein